MFEIILPLAFMTMIISELSSARGGLFAIVGDEDMKIAQDGFSSAPTGDSCEAEEDAKAYMSQKNAGNVDKARALGEEYAEALHKVYEDIGAALTADDPYPLRAHHKTVLFSYAVNRVIANLSPNSILAQTALNVFYDEMEQKNPELAEHLLDMAAFSLYILCERSDDCDDSEMGSIYAKLCGGEGDKELAEEGNRLYREYYDVCAALHERTSYTAV